MELHRPPSRPSSATSKIGDRHLISRGILPEHQPRCGEMRSQSPLFDQSNSVALSVSLRGAEAVTASAAWRVAGSDKAIPPPPTDEIASSSAVRRIPRNDAEEALLCNPFVRGPGLPGPQSRFFERYKAKKGAQGRCEDRPCTGRRAAYPKALSMCKTSYSVASPARRSTTKRSPTRWRRNCWAAGVK